MRMPGISPPGSGPPPGEPRHRDLRWDGRVVRVTTPAPADAWAALAAADPTTLPFQTTAWRHCVCAGSGWQDASRLYETAGGRQLVLMMARRSVGPRLAVEASWPAGWGAGGVLAAGGVRPEEAALVCADLARGRVVSASVRPGFGTAPAWRHASTGAFVIPRAVHVVHFSGESFDAHWARSVPAKMRRGMRNARRHQEQAGVTITSGNSPELVAALYQVYLRWIDCRAGQRKVPASMARWQARRAEPFGKFSTVASALGAGCRIWVAWWEGRPIGASVSLYAGDAAVGWRAYTDRSVPTSFRLFEILAVEALRHACESGCRYMEMGESVGRPDLAAIKERLGGQEHAFAEYCFERAPMSRGRMALQRLRRNAEQRIVAHRGRAAPQQPGRPA
ncbi:MAG TPA: GNAT family N-acetyltransferase [Streptosporangiaceae bacterium]|nr:GNAT family N-acetyltransferase [Streptosporangiaceae bacterium]